MPFNPSQPDQLKSKYISMAYSASYGLFSIVVVVLLLSHAANAIGHPKRAARQQPTFECANIVGSEPFDALVKRVVAIAENQAFLTTQSVSPELHPVSVLPSTGKWETQKPGHWMAGFWPGVLWQLHALTGNPIWAEKAQLWQKNLAGKQREFVTQHDWGFIYLPSFANSYAVTNSTEDLRQALAAAEALSWAFNPNCNCLRTFEGWSPRPIKSWASQIVIIDFMINIQMLVWGAKHVGQVHDLRMDADPASTWMQMAISHARQVAKNHVRPDGSSYHIVEYNPFDGTVNRRYTYQGFADSSTWSRGQAWGMAGFSLLYEQTNMPEFRDTAIKVTDRYLALLDRQEQQALQRVGGAASSSSSPAAAAAAGTGNDVWDRWVPMWDFDAPYKPELDGPRDTSGGAVAALAMLHLARALSQEDAVASQRYLCAGVSTLRALSTSKYLVTPGVDMSSGILKHATGGMPLGLHIDVGLISADYYFLEALQMCNSWEPCRLFGTSVDNNKLN